MSAARPVYRLDPAAPRFATVIHALERNARELPARTALIVDDRSLTYAELARAVAGWAHRLRALGATRGTRVAVCMPNGLETAVALLAAMAAGAQVAPINPAFTDAEILRALGDVQARVLIVTSPMLARAADIATQAGVPHTLALGDGGESIDAVTAPHLELPQPLPVSTDMAAMFFTGGTTGVPKAAEHDHRRLTAQAHAALGIWPIQQDREIVLNVAPNFHIWGFWFTVLVPMHAGATTVVAAAFKPPLVLDLFSRHRVTFFAGGPSAIYVGLRGAENYPTTDFGTLKTCISGGAPCSEELLLAWERETKVPIHEGIGMSECAPISGNPVRGRRKLRSVGLPCADTDIDIVDLDTGTRVLPVGEAGEIRVRGPQVMLGYRNKPEETAHALRDGWLYTGDIGYFDDEGYMFVVDRKKEMILVSGFNVYPREIDEHLHKHPAIHEAATIGVPDARSGEAVKAIVALKPGARLTAEELDAYCRASLVKYKVPRHIAFVDALPKTAAGKIDKLALKRAATL